MPLERLSHRQILTSEFGISDEQLKWLEDNPAWLGGYFTGRGSFSFNTAKYPYLGFVNQNEDHLKALQEKIGGCIQTFHHSGVSRLYVGKSRYVIWLAQLIQPFCPRTISIDRMIEWSEADTQEKKQAIVKDNPLPQDVKGFDENYDYHQLVQNPQFMAGLIDAKSGLEKETVRRDISICTANKPLLDAIQDTYGGSTRKVTALGHRIPRDDDDHAFMSNIYEWTLYLTEQNIGTFPPGVIVNIEKVYGNFVSASNGLIERYIRHPHLDKNVLRRFALFTDPDKAIEAYLERISLVLSTASEMDYPYVGLAHAKNLAMRRSSLSKDDVIAILDEWVATCAEYPWLPAASVLSAILNYSDSSEGITMLIRKLQITFPLSFDAEVLHSHRTLHKTVPDKAFPQPESDLLSRETATTHMKHVQQALEQAELAEDDQRFVIEYILMKDDAYGLEDMSTTWNLSLDEIEARGEELLRKVQAVVIA